MKAIKNIFTLYFFPGYGYGLGLGLTSNTYTNSIPANARITSDGTPRHTSDSTIRIISL